MNRPIREDRPALVLYADRHYDLENYLLSLNL